MLAGLPPPLEPPDRPRPPELADAVSHGYNCRCVARHFGLDPAAYRELPACALTEAEYDALLAEAFAVQAEAKRLAVARDVAGAQRAYTRMRQLAQQLDRVSLEVAAVSDLATVCYSAGDLRNARQCAEAVLSVFAVSTAAIVHFGQYAELRMIEGSREVAERVLISLSTEEGDLDKARELLADQRRRAAFRKAAEPGQFPREQLDPHGADELELRILEVRVQVAAGVTGDVAEASYALGTLLLLAGEVAQARDQFEHAGKVWAANGDTPGARRLASALARCAAAEGDWPSAEEQVAELQAAARESGEWLECLRANYLSATIGYARGEDPRAVLDLLLPVALAAQEYRFAFASAQARTAWANSVAGPATELLMVLLTQLGETRLAAEMIERACAVGAYPEDRSLDLTGELPTLTTTPAESDQLPLAALGSVTSSLPFRLAPPPGLRWSPSSPMELDAWSQLAAARYGCVPAPRAVESWPAADPGRETFILRYADAGHTYLSWRTTSDLDTVHTHPIDADLVDTARGFLAEASPTPREGERVADAVRRSLDAFSAGEQRLARVLALNLLPADLVAQLRRATRPLLRIQPSPALATVPWGLLALPDRRPAHVLEADEVDTCFDSDVRILDLADVSLLAPAGIPRREPAPGGPPVYLLDPRIPGQSAFGELGSVLGKQDATSPLIRHLDAQLATGPVRPAAVRGLDLVRRTDTDRQLLAEVLASACSRLVFAGHVSRIQDVHGAQTALHLSCSADLPGTAAPIGAHRPFTAADLALSEVDMPARVALIGCASASDFGLPEPFGVLLAAVAAGAGLVAATVWALPTSAAVPGADPMAELIIAVDTALAGPDPVAKLCAWQRERLAHWRERPEPARSPAFWAALTCLDATDDGKSWAR
ncbi:hypothetical protein ACFXPA_09315 [Amycolatopsis sp. NPDC059090]|uniref:hypothetical protein n=1 Tax=Amycolatopsis sp. NPDC059090 TaxID=3346723 RepID=UPI003671B56F